MKKQKLKNMKEKNGITLIALVITIIVLLILAGVLIPTLSGENGILTKVQNAERITSEENLKEIIQADILGYQAKNKSEGITTEQLREIIYKYFENAPETEADLVDKLNDENYSLRLREKYGKNIELKLSEIYRGKLIIPNNPIIEIGGKKIRLNKENINEYLGKEVINFKEDYENTEETIHIGEKETGQDITVSKKYRLYYVDFENKFGDGEGTIYLKAECISNKQLLPLNETSTAEDSNVKTKQLNPALYAKDVTPVPNTRDNMKAVAWLLNEKNWVGLKDSVNIELKENVNYIVGAPSLEMMIDSYNTYYKLDGNTPIVGDCNPGDARKKLFYAFEGGNGYVVGPSSTEPYSLFTANYTVQKDEENDIGTLYNPGDFGSYWLGSPCNKVGRGYGL